VAVTLIRVKVRPNARRVSFVQQPDGTWLAAVRSPPVEGRANRELIELVAGHFRCAKAAVSIKSGASGRTKLVRIEAG
jgi:uncharacterized protein